MITTRVNGGSTPSWLVANYKCGYCLILQHVTVSIHHRELVIRLHVKWERSSTMVRLPLTQESVVKRLTSRTTHFSAGYVCLPPSTHRGGAEFFLSARSSVPGDVSLEAAEEELYVAIQAILSSGIIEGVRKEREVEMEWQEE